MITRSSNSMRGSLLDVERPELTTHDLVADLRALGVASGDVVMVHASLRAIGAVEGGASGVIDALEAATGVDGTVLVVIGARDDWDWVNERPERERAALLRDATPFDAHTTPADPEVGVLAEVFRRRPTTRVSDHPEGRFAASGRMATTLLEDVPWDDYYGPGSPLDRFVRARGKVLRMGADLDTLTVLHYAEYLAPIASKRRVRRHRLVTGEDGPELRIVECLDDSDGIVDYPGEDYFAVILREYLASKRAKTGVVGRAASELIDALDVVKFAVAWMDEHFTAR
jgi:aminoglycoside N3'-acetyltransferase